MSWRPSVPWRGRRVRAIAVIVACCLAGTAAAACRPPYHGINLVPLPQGWYQGAVELLFPTAAHIAYYKGAGMNAIRLPLVWETLQPVLYGELDARYLGHVREFLERARAQDMPVLLDLHNYARYRGNLVGSAEVPLAAFEDLWRRLAAALRAHPAVLGYGLMNEPHDSAGLWPAAAQAGVDGVRAADRERPIYVAGDSWSNAQRWPAVHAAPFVRDPAGRIVYEAHLYFDDDFSGRYKTPPGNTDVAARAERRLAPFLRWLAAHGQRGAIGETGVPMDDARWLDALAKFLDMSAAACLDWFI
ncbi:MAG: cellulase family glycosylhydrolase, partial [Rhodocyclaceae bacterium]|nr:cellulase family glycosylhydrolase [Rhodocyclaceae bacterium]